MINTANEDMQKTETIDQTLPHAYASASNGNLGNAYYRLGHYEKAIQYHEKHLEISTAIGNQSGIAASNGNLGVAYHNLGQYEKAIQYHEKHLKISTAIGNQSGIAASNGNLGVAYHNLGQYEKAIQYHEKSLEISTAIGDQLGIGTSNGNLGNAYESLGQYEKAIQYYEKHLEISTAIGDQSGIARSNGNLGNAYQSFGQYEKAIQYHEKDLEISTAIGDQSGIARSNGNLGNAYYRLGHYEKAIQYHEKHLEISTAIGNQSGIATSNGNLGNAYQSLGQYEKAIQYHEKHLEISTAIGNQLGIGTSNGNLGYAYESLGQYEKAIQYNEKHLEISTAIGNQSGIATSNGNLGNAYQSFGQYVKAIQYHEKHLEISTAIGDQLGIAGSNGNLGNAYYRLGHYEKAIQYHEKHLEISTAIGDQSGIAGSNGNLGIAYQSLGQYEKAIQYHEKDLEISTAIGDQSGIAGSNGNLGIAYQNLGQYEKAIQYHEKHLEISTAIGNQSGIAASNGNLGVAYHNLAQYEKAIQYHEKHLKISTAIGDQSGIAESNGNLGKAYQSLGQYEKAIQYHEKDLEISTTIGNQLGIGRSNGNLGHCHCCVGEYEVSLPYLGRAIKIFDKIFLDMIPDQSKLTYTELYFAFHKISMACFLDVNNLEAALFVMDRGKAKELSVNLRKQRKYSKRGKLEYANPVWEAKQRKQELKEIEIILEVETYSATVLFFAFDLKNCLNVWILNKNLIHMKLDVSLEVVNSSIFGLLEKFDVSVGRGCSFFNLEVHLSSNENNIFCSEKSNRKPLSKHAANPLVSVDNQEILRKICQLMIDPVNDLIAGEKLIIVPDQSLFFAPFSSLIDERGCYLSHSYSIQITPSLHSLRAIMEKPTDSNLGIALFVGNPAVGNVSLHGMAFPDLPSAAQEVQSLSKLFQARPLLGRDAQKQVVLKLLDKASIIHIAAHGEPNSGEIILAPCRSQRQSISPHPTQESFLLTQEDIINISVKARLVVLCCCHTGQGKVTSEGVIGITRSFLAAGARSVLATLWPINDTATKEFMEKLYEYLCQEIRVCEALRRTKNIFQNHEKQHYQSVKIWAPFTIYGEDVKFEKDEIEKIKEESRIFFDDFVILS